MCVCSEESCITNDSLLSKSNHQPLCASNNMTFNSECAMAVWKCMQQQSGLYKKYDGECQSKKKKNIQMINQLKCSSSPIIF
jgi:hypothetical protein